MTAGLGIAGGPVVHAKFLPVDPPQFDAMLSRSGDGTAQPVVSSDGTWAGVMGIVIGGLFLAAGTIGPIARREMSNHLPRIPLQ